MDIKSFIAKATSGKAVEKAIETAPQVVKDVMDTKLRHEGMRTDIKLKQMNSTAGIVFSSCETLISVATSVSGIINTTRESKASAEKFYGDIEISQQAMQMEMETCKEKLIIEKRRLEGEIQKQAAESQLKIQSQANLHTQTIKQIELDYQTTISEQEKQHKEKMDEQANAHAERMEELANEKEKIRNQRAFQEKEYEKWREQFELQKEVTRFLMQQIAQLLQRADISEREQAILIECNNKLYQVMSENQKMLSLRTEE